MSVSYVNSLGVAPSDAAHEGHQLTTWTSPSADRQGGTLVITVSRHRDANPGNWIAETQVLATHTESVATGFNAYILSVATVVDTTHGWSISLAMANADGSPFAVVDGTGAITWT